MRQSLRGLVLIFLQEGKRGIQIFWPLLVPIILGKEYDKKWVIVDNQSIVGCSSTYDQISKSLKNRKTALLEFVDSEQIAMFF